MSDRATHLLWVDLETTGLDPDLDCIIEVGSILTDVSLNPISTFQSVVRPDAFALHRMMENDIVLTMHNESGLIPLLDGGEYIEEVDSALAGIIEASLGNRSDTSLLVAGSGVGHHDKSFILKYMPQVAALTDYPVIDVGVVRRFLRDVVGWPEAIPTDGESATKKHRAMDDVQQHFHEAMHYVELLRRCRDASESTWKVMK